MIQTMMSQPLLVSTLINHAERYHAKTEVVSVETTGGIERTNWGKVAKNSRKLASALEKIGITSKQRCATIAWNNRRHLEIYFGVSGAGFVCHTINPRLFPEQLSYIINHAEDQVLFFDKTFLPLIMNIKDSLSSVKAFVLLGAHNDEAANQLDGLLFYDELIETGDDHYSWPELDELTPSSLCYTSGTTGQPKGVLYTHRSTLLHALVANNPDGFAVSSQDTMLPVVPMFHVNAWGMPYTAASTGCKLILPGPGLDGDSLVKLIDNEKVTLALGVPTIWMGLLAALESSGSKAESLTRTIVGGSALPPSMISIFRDKYNVKLIHAWGMTETSPLGSINHLLQKHSELSEPERELISQGQGRPPFGVELRLIDDEGGILQNDGKSQGNLQIKGHWIVEHYFGHEASALTEDGWFDTGDIATLDADGYMIIRDRSKDIIKSGGEWISTVELENIAVAHPQIVGAAAIAAEHEKWAERPIIIAIKESHSNVSEEDIIAFYEGKIPAWQTPDAVIFVDELPIGGTGKILKNKLRDQYGKVLL